MDMQPNDAALVCWEQHAPSYEQASRCYHAYLSAYTRAEVERQREYNRKNPIQYRQAKYRAWSTQ